MPFEWTSEHSEIANEVAEGMKHLDADGLQLIAAMRDVATRPLYECSEEVLQVALRALKSENPGLESEIAQTVNPKKKRVLLDVKKTALRRSKEIEAELSRRGVL